MHPTTTNLIIFATVALTLAAVGGCILRLSGNSRNRLQALLRVFVRILMVIGFFLAGTLVWGHLSGQLGPKQVWFRAPSFYFAAAFLCASAFWWFYRPVPHTVRGIASLFGYPVLLILLVGGWQLAVHYQEGSKIGPLHTALRSAKGQVAPEIQFLDEKGEPHKLSEIKGKVVLLNFWATTCGPCEAEMPELSALQRKFRDRGFVLVYLSPEGPDVLARFFRGRNLDGVNGRLTLEFPIPAFYSFGKAWPINFLVGRDGLVIDNWLGAAPMEWTEKKIQKEL